MDTIKVLNNKFWEWYNRHYLINLTIASLLFVLQLVHLYWLSTHVVAQKLTGNSYFNPSEFYEKIIIFVDYTEVPALISTTLIYINNYRKNFHLKNLFYIFLLNVQWIHLYWITDEFVVHVFDRAESTSFIVTMFAWIAILIDYLELPVIFDTLKKFFNEIHSKATID